MDTSLHRPETLSTQSAGKCKSFNLCTNLGIRHHSGARRCATVWNVYNLLFLIDIILFKYCANKSEALRMEDLRELFGVYSQSYPHNLWVKNFLICNKKLHSYSENFSSYRKQLSDAI